MVGVFKVLYVLKSVYKKGIYYMVDVFFFFVLGYDVCFFCGIE